MRKGRRRLYLFGWLKRSPKAPKVAPLACSSFFGSPVLWLCNFDVNILMAELWLMASGVLVFVFGFRGPMIMIGALCKLQTAHSTLHTALCATGYWFMRQIFKRIVISFLLPEPMTSSNWESNSVRSTRFYIFSFLHLWLALRGTFLILWVFPLDKSHLWTNTNYLRYTYV